jgi:hypothetical protein
MAIKRGVMMFKSIKEFIKCLWYYQGRYITISGFYNRPGESSNELFKRTDNDLKRRIRKSYPTMTETEYMAYPTDQNVFPHRRDLSEDYHGVGSILSRIPNEKGKLELWVVIYRIIPTIDLQTISNLLKGNIHDVYSIPYHMFKEIKDE